MRIARLYYLSHQLWCATLGDAAYDDFREPEGVV